MPVTIDDVARTAGVSTATVSRALRGLPHVSERTRAAVLRTAVDLGYVPSKSASTLAGGRTSTVGVVTPYIARWWFSHAIEGLEQELHAVGYDVLLSTLPPDRSSGRQPFDAEQLRQRVDAVAVLTVPLTGVELDALRRLAVPTVFVGDAVTGAMSVRVDDVEVGRTATGHLLALGHRSIGFIGGDPGEPLSSQAPIDRRAGWMSALRSAGVAPDARLDLPGPLTPEGGRRAVRALLQLERRPTAVVAACDEMAFGALLEARAAGLDVPGDLSLTGVDDHDLAELLDLTTVAQPVAEQGRSAARMLLAALDGTTVHAQEHRLLPVTLRVRGTTAPLR